jgi:hypothetical protein
MAKSLMTVDGALLKRKKRELMCCPGAETFHYCNIKEASSLFMSVNPLEIFMIAM